MPDKADKMSLVAYVTVPAQKVLSLEANVGC